MEINKKIKASCCGDCMWWKALCSTHNKGWGRCEFEFPREYPFPKIILRGYVLATDAKECACFEKK
jgi:hypothetical protein